MLSRKRQNLSLVKCKLEVKLSKTFLMNGVKTKTTVCVEKKNQLDATEGFIALIICSTCLGHFYAHHQELETICVLLPPMMSSVLVTGCRRSGVK